MKRFVARLRWWLMLRGVAYRYDGEDGEGILVSTRRLTPDEVKTFREAWLKGWRG